MRRLNCYQIRCDGIENGFRCDFGNCIDKLNTKSGIPKRNLIIEKNRELNDYEIGFQELENILRESDNVLFKERIY